MKQLTPPRAILFDWDNTLVDSWPVIHAALHNTFVALEQEPWTLDQTRARVSKSMRDSFPGLFGEDWERAASIYQKDYRSRHISDLQILPHAEEMLTYLKGTPLYVAVVSNKRGDTLRKEATHLGWDRYFSKLVGAGDAQRDKPYPDPVHLALEESGIASGEDVWFVGDSSVDLECAASSGCTALFFGENSVSEGRHEGVNYHHHIPSHAYFIEHLKQLF